MDKLSSKSHKIKIALFFGYNGKAYHGLQKASGVPTVEESLEKAIYDAKFIAESNFGDLKKIGWARGSRTDKGVHACLNTINCKLLISDDFVDHTANSIELTKQGVKETLNRKAVISTINNHLPSDIRTFALKFVTKSFNVKNSARSRRYEYFLPLNVVKTKQYENLSDDEFIAKFDKALKIFEGSHNFHNYTKKGDFKDKASVRVLFELKASLYSLQGDENKYILINLLGQSFMYNQIRKMVGMLIYVFRNDIDTVFIENSFGRNVYDVWLAPSEGLLLEGIQFDGYNKKGDIPESLELNKDELADANDFKVNTIYKQIAGECENNGVFEKWVETLENNNK